jgi:hypothetical protein
MNTLTQTLGDAAIDHLTSPSFTQPHSFASKLDPILTGFKEDEVDWRLANKDDLLKLHANTLVLHSDKPTILNLEVGSLLLTLSPVLTHCPSTG